MRAEGNQGELPGGSSTSSPLCRGRGVGLGCCTRAVSPNGSVQRPCGRCWRNSAIGQLALEGSLPGWAHARLRDVLGLGVLVLGKQACCLHPFLCPPPMHPVPSGPAPLATHPLLWEQPWHQLERVRK